MSRTHRTICDRDCPDACAILAKVEGGRVTRLSGDPAHPVTRGFLCYRTSHFLTTQYSPDRLLSPMLRRGDSFEPVSWEEALDLAAARLNAIRAESGGAAILHYRGGGSLGILKGITDLFFERFGPVTVKRGSICSGAGDAAQLADFGVVDSNDLFDLANAKNIVLWGKNPYISSPHLVPLLREAAARGTRLLLVDPIRHRTAKLCERFVQVQPGGDFALAMAVAQLLFARGGIDPEARRYCDDLDAFEALAKRQSIDEWCRAADVSTADAEAIAARLADRPTAILVGWGMGRRQNGAAIVRALDALGAVSGNLGIPGGGVSFYFRRRAAFDAPHAGRSARTVAEPLLGEEIDRAKDPPIRAVWITAANPVVMLPDSECTARALASRDFVVVVDRYMTDTARQAHLVLPTTTLLEADDLVGSYGHHYIGASKPVVPRPEGVRSDLEIIQGLAARLGLADVVAGDAASWKARLTGRLCAAGVSAADLETRAVRSPFAPKVLFRERRFSTPSGKVSLITEPPPERTPDADYPLVLMAVSTLDSQSSQWVEPQAGPAEARVHPNAAAGLADGALCRLESRVSALTVRLVHDRTLRRDVLHMKKGGHLAAGQCANALVAARLTDLGEGGALYDEPVRLRPL